MYGNTHRYAGRIGHDATACYGNPHKAVIQLPDGMVDDQEHSWNLMEPSPSSAVTAADFPVKCDKCDYVFQEGNDLYYLHVNHNLERLDSITPVFVEAEISPDLKHGELYISMKYGIAQHLCACGCCQKTVMGFKPEWDDGWTITEQNGLVSFTPSVGNFSGENPYHAHYYITNNKIVWC